jgi:subtilisin family serine protease
VTESRRFCTNRRAPQGYDVGLKRGLLPAALPAAFVAAAFSPAPATAYGSRAPTTEVVVTLDAPPLARAFADSRVLSTAAKNRRLDFSTPTSAAYLRNLARAQTDLQRRITTAIPAARVRWHYRVVLDGLAVVVPLKDIPRLSSLRGVAHVYPSVSYHRRLYRSPQLIGAPILWGPSLSTAGQGIKIGVIDDGVDQRHPFFNMSGFTMPPGFPKGRTAYTTRKVIVARAFAPPSPKWRYASRPFDPVFSEHATHVAGIAAGDHGVNAESGRRVSGIAPKAYIGNYKVLTIPTDSGVGLDGNSAEIAAGIESAVRDGMDVINLSLGEPEIERGRDLVVKAIDAAADAGVVPALAAGNDYDEVGRGSVGSPGTASKAITSAAVSKRRVIASFSSAGPTAISLQFKPDVSAPGVNILSSVPGGWDAWDGTSMASPHVAGGAALLRQRHPGWTVAQIKSALVQTGRPVFANKSRTREALPLREGGGLIYLPDANKPLLFAQPADLSFAYLRRGRSATRSISLQDAGGGAGTWAVTVQQRTRPAGVKIRGPATVSVPGPLKITASATAYASQGDASGFVVLTRRGKRRRIPYWGRLIAPKLQRHGHGVLRRTGTYRGNTKNKRALVSRYRYPENPHGLGVPVALKGPEQVFRVQLRRPVANFGVAVLRQARGVRIQPRVVVAGNENKLTGYAALPVNLNPYLPIFLQQVRAAGAIRPKGGRYDVVFDSRSRGAAGRFRFRFWIGDTARPVLRLLTHSVRRGGTLHVSAKDRGSGVDPASILAGTDGGETRARYSARRNQILIPTGSLHRGTHRLALQVSDYQESRNMENVARILPNTRRLSVSFRVR